MGRTIKEKFWKELKVHPKRKGKLIVLKETLGRDSKFSTKVTPLFESNNGFLFSEYLDTISEWSDLFDFRVTYF